MNFLPIAETGVVFPNVLLSMAGTTGFEPATSSVSSELKVLPPPIKKRSCVE